MHDQAISCKFPTLLARMNLFFLHNFPLVNNCFHACTDVGVFSGTQLLYHMSQLTKEETWSCGWNEEKVPNQALPGNTKMNEDC